MSKKTNIIKTIQNLKFFDSNLKMFPDKILALKQSDSLADEKRLYRESKLVRKLLTIHTYLQCANSYDIIENPKQIITKAQFKKNVTSSAAEQAKDGVITIGPILAQYMDEKEFNLMLEIYWNLKQ
jgi:hypothetical protein